MICRTRIPRQVPGSQPSSEESLFVKNYVRAAPGERSSGVGFRTRAKMLRDDLWNRRKGRTARPRRDARPGLLSSSPTRREMAGGMRLNEQVEPRQCYWSRSW